MTTETAIAAFTAAEAQCEQGRVLIVDDDKVNLTVLRKPLEIEGYEVTEAQSGAEALDLVAKRPPNAVLLDIMMPEMDGYEVCRRLKGSRSTAAIPVLMVTALGQREERLKGIAAGANDFLTKPVDVRDLTLRVKNAVYTNHLFEQLRSERRRSEDLLLNVLPKPIADRMLKGEVQIADQHREVTILVADLVGLTGLMAHIAPEQIVYLLTEIFSTFDGLVEAGGLEKIKTFGGSYVAAGGVPLPLPGHAEAIARVALSMREEIRKFNAEYSTSISLRAGISIGGAVAGVIGRKKFAYDLWGDVVNSAWRYESSAAPGSIQVSAAVQEILKGKFLFEPAAQPTGASPGGAENVYLLVGAR